MEYLFEAGMAVFTDNSFSVCPATEVPASKTTIFRRVSTYMFFLFRRVCIQDLLYTAESTAVTYTGGQRCRLCSDHNLRGVG